MRAQGGQARATEGFAGARAGCRSAGPLARPDPRDEDDESLEISLKRPLDETIERILAAALALEGGNRSRAARRLGLSLRTLQRYAARGPGATP